MPPDEAALSGALEVLAATASRAHTAPVPSQADSNNNFFVHPSAEDEGRDKKKKRKKHSRTGKEKQGKRRKEKKMNREEGVAMVSIGSEKEVKGGDGKLSPGSNGANKPNSDEQRNSSTLEIRKGKWTVEEEEYTTRVIHYFSSGLITLPGGKTLRSFLAEKLQCDPMRITKKYAGAACLGKRIHNLCENPQFTPQEIETAKGEIKMLEERFRMRLELGDGAVLPPLQPAPVIVGTTLSAEAARRDVTSRIEVVDNDNSQRQIESFGHLPCAPDVNGTTYSNQQPYGSAPAPGNNAVNEILQGLTRQPQFQTSLANNPNYSTLLKALSQSTMATSKPQYMPALQAQAPPPTQASLDVALQQILQQANISGFVPRATAFSQGCQPQVQTQEAQASSMVPKNLQQLLLSFNPSAPAPSLSTVTNANTINTNNANNDLTQTLLSQVITELKMLSAMNPSRFQAVHSLLDPATTPSNPTLLPQVAPNLGINDPSALLKAIQQLGSLPTSFEPSQQMSQVGTEQNPQQSGMNSNNELQDVFAQQQHLSSIQGMLQNRCTQLQQQQPRTQSAASRNLQSLIAAQQAASANAANNPPLAESYNAFMSNLAKASKSSNMVNSLKPAPMNNESQQQKGAQNTPPQNIQHAEASGSDALSQMISNLVKDNPSLLTSTDVNALITASRNTDTQGMCLNNTDSIHQGSHEVLELPVPNHLKTVPQEASFFANSQRLAQHNKNSHGDSGPLKKRLKMSP